MDYLDVWVKTQPYVHATYRFGKNAQLFFEEYFEVALRLLAEGITPINYDETIFNVMLCKHAARDWVDPYDIYYGVFLRGFSIVPGGYPPEFRLDFHSCPGITNPFFARSVLESMLEGHTRHG
jgi:hypothetical protein